jgi:hypothetical protein
MKNKKLIKEDIESIKFMMNYDTRKTLTENREFINEQGFPTKPNPGGWAAGVAMEIGNSVKGPGTKEIPLIDAIKKIKTAQHFFDVQSLLKSNTNGEYGTFTRLVNGEMEFSNFNEVKEISDHFNSIPGISSKYDSEKAVTNRNGVKGEQNSFKPKSFTVFGYPTDPRLKSLFGGGGNKANNTALSGNTKTPDKTTKKAVTPPPIPPQLKDSAGVIKFQDWLDVNKPGWATGLPEGKLNRGSGYGKFGPRTTKAWTAYGNEYLNPSKTPVDASKLAAPAVQTYTTADQTKNTPALDTLPMGISGPANQVAQPTTTTTETLPAGISGPANQVTKTNNTFNTSSATNPNKDKELKLS